jgi:hypothetical protein
LIGIHRTPFTHFAFPGAHGVPFSTWGHGARTAATPRLGTVVVNGYGAIGASSKVSALKNVDFPTFGFPTIPTSTSPRPPPTYVV